MSDFEDIEVSWAIGLGYGADQKGTVPLSSLIDKDDWESMSQTERELFLDDVLETEIQNHLDAAIWLEGEED